MFEQLENLKILASQHEKELIIIAVAVLIVILAYYLRTKKVTLAEVATA